MSRLIPAGSIVLTPTDARILYQAAKLKELRSKYRIGDSRVYELLTEISLAAFSIDAESGKLDRQETATEQTGYRTVKQLALATGLSTRAVRLDCQRGEVPSIKSGNAWLIAEADAATYVTGRARRT